MRDLHQVADKLKVVLMPLGKESQSNVIQKLRECTLPLSHTIAMLINVPSVNRGSLGPSHRVPASLMHPEYHCSGRFRLICVCGGIRHRVDRSRHCDSQCSVTRYRGIYLAYESNSM